ncbi:hypothetical protein [Streptomyces sp. NPDC001568]|uniref:hypothetical protein n=1 Tax=Streptomyces sp. NPDC001568 TaxID=3364588 RepID=UPI00369C57FC
MRRSEFIALLVAETGDLRPDPGTSLAELADLRRAVLVSGGLGGPGVDSAVAEVDEPLRAELEYLVDRHLADHDGDGSVRQGAARPSRLVRRGSLFAAEEGAAPERSFGPFLDGAGRRVWYDLFRAAARWFDVRIGHTGPVFLKLPHLLPEERLLHPPAAAELPAGSVWIAARRLAVGAPANQWAGLRITGGEVRFIGPVSFSPGTAEVTRDSRVQLTLDLASPANGPGPGPVPGTGAGADAAHSVCELPRTVTFLLDPDGTGAVGAFTAALEVLGCRIGLRHDEAQEARYEAGSGIRVPAYSTPRTFAVTRVRSRLFAPSGAARVVQASWMLPLVSPTLLSGAAFGESSGAGRLLLRLGTGLRAAWQGMDGGPIPLPGAEVSFDGSRLRWSVHSADWRRARQTFRLWPPVAKDPQTRSALEIAFPVPGGLLFNSLRKEQADVLSPPDGLARTRLDQPRTAAGERVDSALTVRYSLVDQADDITLTLETVTRAGGTPAPQTRMALALTNALLTTTTPLAVFLIGSLGAPGQVDTGRLDLSFGLLHLLPMLPDPYAANFAPLPTGLDQDGASVVRAHLAWEPGKDADLAIELPATAEDGTPQESVPAAGILPLVESPGRADREADLPDETQGWLRRARGRTLGLLDLSSAADRLGVAVLVPGRNPLASFTVDGLTLHTKAGDAAVFLLPQFQWEPVRNRPNPLTKHTKQAVLTFANDGGPTVMGANSVVLVPVSPVHMAEEVVRAYAQDRTRSVVLASLPFGIRALASLDPDHPAYRIPPDLRLLRVPFEGFTGARRLSLRAGVRSGEDGEPDPLLPPILLGWARQSATFPQSDPTEPELTSVLSPLADSFNATFGREVPLSRVDFGGYGADIVSRWVDTHKSGVSISQVAFDGYHGRTAFERIQLTTLLFPCAAMLVRTITLERYGSGSVVRWDSGWAATTPGLFNHPNAEPVCHPGVVQGMYDIREIRDTDVIVELAADGTAPKADVQAVYYDADLGIDGVQQGQGANGKVPVHHQLGFVQRIPLGAALTGLGVGPLTPAQLKELFDLQGPIGGPADCTIRIGASPHTMRVTGVRADNAGVNPASHEPEFAVAACGSPHLPAAGQWTVVRVDHTSGTVGPVDGQRGVPLIRRNAPASSAGQPFRWADPQHLFTNNPETDYALLCAGDTQRILYARPRIGATATNISSPLNPLLADPYAMLRTSGLFPRLDEALDLGRTCRLTISSGLLRLSPDKTVTFTPPPHSQRLVSASAWTTDARYEGTGFTVRSANDWTVDATRIAQRLAFLPFGTILEFVHDIHAPAVGPTGFPAPEVRPGDALRPVAEVLDLLQKLVPGTAADAGERVEVPALPGPLHVTTSSSGTSYRLAAVADFLLQGEDGQGVECGIGKVRGGLKLGAELVADVLSARVGGSVFLEITGGYQQLVFPEIYGGGELRFRIRGDASGTAAVELDACTVGSVGGDLIPHLIELEATVKYGYFIGVDGDRFRPGAIVGMAGRAKLLSGLLGFSLSVEGRLVLDRVQFGSDPEENRVRLRGDILVAGTVTVAWAIKKRKSFHTTFDVVVDWKTLLVAAKAGILPVP